MHFSQVSLERLFVSPHAFFFFSCLNKNELMSSGPFEFFIYFVFLKLILDSLR